MLKRIILLCILASCSHPQTSIHEYQVGAYLWQQNSGEYQALCYQAYNLARIKLDRELENKHNKKRAVVFDLDETVLNNSFLGAFDIKNNIPWSQEHLAEWVAKKEALAIAGAKEFIDYAVANRVEVFYVSDREKNQVEDTFLNLKKLNIPAKKENLLFKTDDDTKESRRLEIKKKYEIVLYFGDNLHDFDKAWDGIDSKERKRIVDLRSREFGDKFIVLPNPLYGEWESSLPKVKDRKENLIITP